MGWLRSLFRAVSREKMDGIHLDTTRAYWETIGPRSFTELFQALQDWLPQNAILYFEGGSADAEINEFMANFSIPEQTHVAMGTLWPRPKVFHVPGSEVLLKKLMAIMEHHAEAELAVHFHIYRGNKVLLEWHDAFTQPMLISGSIPEETVKVFANRIGETYTRVIQEPSLVKRREAEVWLTSQPPEVIITGRKRAAEKGRELLEGKVDGEYFMEEFGESQDPQIQELVEMINDMIDDHWTLSEYRGHLEQQILVLESNKFRKKSMDEPPGRISCRDKSCTGTINEQGYCDVCGKSLGMPMGDEIEITGEDLRIDKWWSGPGKGGCLQITHLPTGVSVYKEYNAKESVWKVKNRLMAELKTKIGKPKTKET